VTPIPAVAILIVAKRIRSEPMSLTPDQERAYIADLKQTGRTQVRSDLDHGRISPALVYIASKWLAEEEREDERRREAFNSEQAEAAARAATAAERAAAAAERASAATDRQAAAAERAATAAERANIRATIALIIAIISIVATVIMASIGIWVTHNDARKTGWLEKQSQSQS
jgi:hypothetical protein